MHLTHFVSFTIDKSQAARRMQISQAVDTQDRGKIEIHFILLTLTIEKIKDKKS